MEFNAPRSPRDSHLRHSPHILRWACLAVYTAQRSYDEPCLKMPFTVMFCVFLGNANPPADLRSWFKCQGSGKTMDSSLAEFPHDIYAIGTQVQRGMRSNIFRFFQFL